jgi:RNA polymerase sigma-70 factor (ECF subfamily)
MDEPPGPDGDAVPLRLVGGTSYADWDEVYTDNVVWVYRLLYAKLGNRADAEDLTAEVFTAALRPLRLQASRPEVRAYLAATCRTSLAGYWRRRVGTEVTTIELVDAARVQDESPTSSDAKARADALLAQLPERHRRVLELRFLEGCSIKEAADTMGISVANTKVLQHRALRRAGAVAKGLDQ